MVVALSAPQSDRASLVPLAACAAAVVAVTLWWRRAADARHDTATKPLRTIHTLPNSLPLVGDLVTCLRHEKRFHDWLSDMCLHFRGEPWRVRIIGQPDLIVISTPEAFECVLASQFSEFPNGETVNVAFSGVFGRSIMTLDGDEWYRQRKTASKFFTARALRVCMLETMRKNVHQLYETLDASVDTGTSVNLMKLFSQFTLQTFTEIGLGVDLRWIGHDESSPMSEAIDVGSPTTMRRFRVPEFWWKFEKAVGFGPEKQLTETMAALREWITGIIDESFAAYAKRQAEGRSKGTDEIKNMLELFFEHSQEDQSGMRAEDLVDFIISFVAAAQDTSAVTLARFFLSLKQHPDVETRIRDEMARVLPKLGVSHDTYLTSDHAQQLVYVEATIRETMRLHSPVPMVQREAAHDTIICGDISIRKGEQVCLPSYAMARNPNVWGLDAAEFKPERWIDQKTGTLITVPATKFSAFGAGPRICAGMKLALMEMRVVAANLLHQYRFSLAEPNDGDYIVGVTLALKSPLCMRAVKARAA